MEISEIKKPNKYVTLVTYLIAVTCLILGLFLPLFDGKGILALQLPDVLNCIAKKQLITTKKPFTFTYPVDLFGMGKVTVDMMAVIVLAYAAVTVLALLALIPVGISFKKEGRAGVIFAYIIEVAAVIVFSLYLIIALYAYSLHAYDSNFPAHTLSYNMVIALAGNLIALIVLSIANKKAAGVAKLFLFLFSALAFLTLFNLTVIIPKLSEPLTNFTEKIKLTPFFFEKNTAINYAILLFEGSPNTFPYYTNFGEYIKWMQTAGDKAGVVLMLITTLVVLLNYFIDVISLTSNTKKAGHIFNMARYSLEVAALVSLYITLAVLKLSFGILLVILSVLVVIQLAMSVIRFLMFRKRAASPADIKPAKKQKPAKKKDDEIEQIRIVRKPDPVKSAANAQQLAFIDPPPKQPEPIIVEAEEIKPAYGPEQISVKEIMAQKREDEQPSAQPVQEIPEIQPVKAEEEKQEEPEVTVQPTYTPPVQEKPAQPAYVPPVQEKPAQPAYVPPVQEKPAQPAYVPPVQEKPAQPAYVPPVQHRQPETQIYTINTIYGGPTDDFLRKLTNDEKIEFARTFIEKSNGETGNIPDYVIGGDNRFFFSSVFIYLGRIRSMISDSLLNKMYKELNMM